MAKGEEFTIGKAGDASINLADETRADFGKNEKLEEIVKQYSGDENITLEKIRSMEKESMECLVDFIYLLPINKIQTIKSKAMKYWNDDEWCKKNDPDYCKDNRISIKKYKTLLVYAYLHDFSAKPEFNPSLPFLHDQEDNSL